jgi:23S rRNA (cytidine1920-2'-O)/16S rRNA (cytidine1409-2'-O)-methyltransferase
MIYGWVKGYASCQKLFWLHVKIGTMARRIRLDQALINKGLVKDLDQARRLIMAGQVLLNGQLTFQSSHMIFADDRLEIKSSPPYVSRGGEKLEALFKSFPLSVDQLICADIGSSTGGFTDCLLQHGALIVYAIDVGYGLLNWNLRNDDRVIVMERTNARNLSALPEKIDFFSIDVSFISIKKIIPQAATWYKPAGGQSAFLIKPQFEADRVDAAKNQGVIQDPSIHQRVLFDVLGFAAEMKFQLKGLMRSPLLGPEGNVEFLAWLTYPTDEKNQDKVIKSRITEIF